MSLTFVSILPPLPLIIGMLCTRPRLLDGLTQIDDLGTLVNRIIHRALHGRTTAHDPEQVYADINTHKWREKATDILLIT